MKRRECVSLVAARSDQAHTLSSLHKIDSLAKLKREKPKVSHNRKSSLNNKSAVKYTGRWGAVVPPRTLTVNNGVNGESQPASQQPCRPREVERGDRGMSSIQSINPATEEVLETFELYTQEQIDQALEQTSTAWKEWRDTTFEQRAELLHQVAQHLRAHKDEYARA